ncbi:MAG: methylglyoxal synthase [Chloroflexota bacterium]|nr:methylglyoxal synthase [Chloroflexota bacterium]
MRKTLALVAHDSKKDDMVQLVKVHKEELAEVDLVATRSTGQLIQERTGLPVTLLQSGSLGGDQQIGALVANGDVTAVIFLRDPLTAHPHEPDVSALLRVCDVHNVPLATNLATAEAVLHLIAEHPEALVGHHLAAQLLEEIAAKHE